VPNSVTGLQLINDWPKAVVDFREGRLVWPGDDVDVQVLGLATNVARQVQTCGRYGSNAELLALPAGAFNAERVHTCGKEQMGLVPAFTRRLAVNSFERAQELGVEWIAHAVQERTTIGPVQADCITNQIAGAMKILTGKQTCNVIIMQMVIKHFLALATMIQESSGALTLGQRLVTTAGQA
jgi:hypothetical protein